MLEVSRVLGHRNITTTANVYGHVMPGSADRIRAAMDAVYGGGSYS
jgi:integrase